MSEAESGGTKREEKRLKKDSDAARAEKYKLIRWSIAAFTLLIGLGFIYYVMTAPGRMAKKMSQQTSDTVGNIAQGLDGIKPVPAPGRALDRASEAAFKALLTHPAKGAEGVAERTFRIANFRGSEDRICTFSIDFGDGLIPIFIAADLKSHATEKSLGSPSDRLIRMVIRTPAQDLPLRSYYVDEEKHWKLRWRRALLNPPVIDELAGKRALDVLKAVPENCGAAL